MEIQAKNPLDSGAQSMTLFAFAEEFAEEGKLMKCAHRSTLLVAVLLITMSVAVTQAQNVTGAIAGNVVDETGLAIPGATVTITEAALGITRTSFTNGVGAFTFTALRPGQYTVLVELAGFASYELTDVTVVTNRQLSIGTVALMISALQETVTVTATGTIGQVETVTSDRSAVITADQLDAITVRGRDITSMLRVLPGVSYRPDSEATGEIVIGSYLPYIGGARRNWATFMIDGVPGNDLGSPHVSSHSISLDAIGEVNVQLNNFEADSGRNGGASVNVVTKAGTNDLSGTAYFYNRHERFRGENFFDKRNGIAKPLYRYNTFGGNIGGPLRTDKAFFFYNYEQWGVDTPQAANERTVPTPLERAGDFSQSFDLQGQLIPIRDPFTQQPFPGNKIPAGSINSDGQALMNFFPLPNNLDRGLTGGNFNYQFKGQEESQRYNNVFRFDFRPTTSDALFVRWSRWLQPSTRFRGGWDLIEHTFTYNDYAFGTSYTKVIGSNFVNELAFGRRSNGEANPQSDRFDLNRLTRAGVGYEGDQFHPEINPFKLLPMMQFGGFLPNVADVTFDRRFVNYGADYVYTINNALSWTTGRHNFKAGGYLESSRNVEGFGARSFPGRFIFSRDPSNPLDTGHPYANAMTGVFAEYREETTRIGQDASGWIGNAFIQDKWQPTAKLTVDIGLRLGKYSHYRQALASSSFVPGRFNAANAPTLYDPFLQDGVRVSRNSITGETGPAVLIGGLIPGSGEAGNGMVLDTDSAYPDNFQDPPPLVFEPRFGVAYDVFGNGQTAVRANVGVFHNTIQPGGLSWLQALNPPIQVSESIFYSTMDTFLSTAGTSFPANNAVGVVRDLPTPTMYNFTAGIQTEIGLGTVLDAAYVGTRGAHLTQTQNINTIPVGSRFLPQHQDATTGRPLADNFFRPYPGYGNINWYTNIGISDYDAAQIQLNRRYSGGLEYTVSYTLSRSRDYTSRDRQLVPLYRNPDTWSYGLSRFDRTHNLTISYIWDFPNIPTDNPIVKGLFDDWLVTGISTLTTGQAVGVGYSTVDNADHFGGGDSMFFVAGGVPPNLSGDPNLSSGDRTLERWFDTSKYSRPAGGQVGNGRKDDIRLPGVNDHGIRLAKRILLGGGQQLEIGWEIYNLFDHVNWLAVDTTARFDAEGNQVDQRFGKVISSGAPRTMQFSLRYRF